MKFFRTINHPFLLAATVFSALTFAIAQAPEEHAKHHPQPQAVKPESMAAMQGANSSDTAKGMNTGGMGGMMSEMGKPPAKELYPSMMQLPDMTPEKRDEIKRLANERISKGNMLLASGLEKLKTAIQNQNATETQEANEQIRLGQSMIQSGLAAQQALTGYKDPSTTALQWFRHEMNLAPKENEPQPYGFFGLSWFHYITMLLFALFAAAMIWMYFHKMKRANALVARLTGSSTENVAPPGEAFLPSLSAGVTTAPVTVNPEIAPTKSNSWSGPLVVSRIFDETPSVKTFRLTDPESGKLPFNYLPGQFITVTIIVNGVPVKRSYTIASSPTLRDSCEITVKHEEKGTVSHYLHTQVHEGDMLQLTGPSGKFTFTETHADSAVLIGGGVGVTPMMSAIRYLTDRSWKGEIFFFFSCKTEADIIFREEIFYLKKRYPNLHVFILLSQPEGEPNDAYITGHITKEILTERVPDITSRMIHICGPKPMMDAVKLMLDELKVPKENVMVEAFGGPPPKPKTAPPALEGDGRPPASKTAPPAQVAGKTATVNFAKSNKTAVLTPDKSVLEASEEVGVNIDYSCRVGTCGICITKLLSGKVTMAVEDALTEDDKAQNMILACQAKATEDVSVNA